MKCVRNSPEIFYPTVALLVPVHQVLMQSHSVFSILSVSVHMRFKQANTNPPQSASIRCLGASTAWPLRQAQSVVTQLGNFHGDKGKNIGGGDDREEE